jgi:hypothetical protein
MTFDKPRTAAPVKQNLIAANELILILGQIAMTDGGIYWSDNFNSKRKGY